MRGWAVVVAAALAVACGSAGPAPTAPSSVATGPVLNLTSGSYRFTLTMATSGTSTPSVCVTINGSPMDVTPAPTDVTLVRDGDNAVARAADPDATLRLTLQLSNGQISGIASGTYKSGTRVVDIEPGVAAIGVPLEGKLRSDSAAGTLSGMVTINGVGCSNNSHMWTLTPI
jgi:hypothetical protein